MKTGQPPCQKQKAVARFAKWATTSPKAKEKKKLVARFSKWATTLPKRKKKVVARFERECGHLCTGMMASGLAAIPVQPSLLDALPLNYLVKYTHGKDNAVIPDTIHSHFPWCSILVRCRIMCSIVIPTNTAHWMGFRGNVVNSALE